MYNYKKDFFIFLFSIILHIWWQKICVEKFCFENLFIFCLGESSSLSSFYFLLCLFLEGGCQIAKGK